MKTAARMTAGARRRSIIQAAEKLFIERGFHATTTRDLATAAGVSEALLFKHFPSKEALYTAIRESCFQEEGTKIIERLDALKPSTTSLVQLVHDMVSHVLGENRHDGEGAFLRLIFRSLIDGGDFTRLAVQGVPSYWVRKVEQCVKAAKASDDLVEGPVQGALGAWFIHQLVSGILVHSLPAEPVIDYGVARPVLVRHAVWFCLRGLGLREEAIAKNYKGLRET